MEIEHQPIDNIAVLAPHADDECIGCGGAILDHITRGDIVKILFMTIGNNQSTDKVHSVRYEEMLMATEILGVMRENISSLWLMEQKIDNYKSAYKLLYNKLTEIKPKIIYCPNKHELDNDHREVNNLLEIYINTNPKHLIEIRYYEVWSTISKYNLAIDITQYFEKKISALKCYKSQIAVKRYDLCVKALNFYRGIMQENGSKYAEVFYQRNLV
jgi:LmbE family N-acetylglucosaminyl deacetylase